jgi:hypothetical protein
MAKKRFANINNAAIERAHLARIENYANQVDKIYKLALEEFARLAASIPNINEEKLFSFKDYPQTSERVNNLLRRTYSQIVDSIKKGNEFEWLAAAEKNDKFVNEVFRSSNLTKDQLKKYNDRNLEALKAFQNRKPDTWNRSQKVWNIKNIPDPKTGLEQSVYKSIKQFKTEMELGIDIGLGEGKSAAVLSRVLRNNLKEPEKLFRRVRDKRGNLVLSKAAEQYNPGTGVYRSSYKNAMRLTRTETNMAYRASDHARWQQLDFVVGIEIRLSNNPNHCPTCEALAGKYPKHFKFVGWHPQCRCHAISILKTDEEIDEDDIRILQGREPLYGSSNEITTVPNNYLQFIKNNEERFKKAKSQPYWIKDNYKKANIKDGLIYTPESYRLTLPYSQQFEVIQSPNKERGEIREHFLVDKKASDYDRLLEIAREKAEDAMDIELMPTLNPTQFEELREIIFSDAKNGKSPDLRIDGFLVEDELTTNSGNINNLRHAVSAGAKQADWVIITLSEPVNAETLKRVVNSKFKDYKDLKKIEFRYNKKYTVFERP